MTHESWIAGTDGRQHTTMAGLTGHVWTTEELFDNVIGLEQDRLAYERYVQLRQKLFGKD